MTGSSEHEITHLLRQWRGGDGKALESLTPLIYRELHRAARQCMGRERDGHTLQPTALINELYLRLDDLRQVDWQNRAHFFALFACHEDVVAVDDALKALAQVDERKCKVVEFRFFGGLSVEETAAVLQVSPDTVARDWRLAKAFLLREMSRTADGP
jgi:RNA polymerase sigma-70 factor (ECF subfamily)